MDTMIQSLTQVVAFVEGDSLGRFAEHIDWDNIKQRLDLTEYHLLDSETLLLDVEDKLSEGEDDADYDQWLELKKLLDDWPAKVMIRV